MTLDVGKLVPRAINGKEEKKEKKRKKEGLVDDEQ